jgi:hypothetical protein
MGCAQRRLKGGGGWLSFRDHGEVTPLKAKELGQEGGGTKWWVVGLIFLACIFFIIIYIVSSTLLLDPWRGPISPLL